MTVRIDVAAQEVRLGGTVLTGVTDASSVAVGALRLPGGEVLRPLTWGERAQVCAAATDASAVALGVLAAAGGAVTGTGHGPQAAHQALAMHLAGADEDGGPGFADVAVTMARALGWPAPTLVGAAAHVVDRLAVATLGTDEPPTGGSDGWTSFVLVDDPAAEPANATDATDGAGAVEALRDLLAADLLARSRAPLGPRAAALLATIEPVAVDAGHALPSPGRPERRPDDVAGRNTAEPTGTDVPGPSHPTPPAGPDRTERRSAGWVPWVARDVGRAGGTSGGRPDHEPSMGDPWSGAPTHRVDRRVPAEAAAEAGSGPVEDGPVRRGPRLATPAWPDGGPGSAGPGQLTTGVRPGPGGAQPVGVAPAGGAAGPARDDLARATGVGWSRAAGPSLVPPGPTTGAHAAHVPAVSVAVVGHGPLRGPTVADDTEVTAELADRLAAALDDESDVRGVLPW